MSSIRWDDDPSFPDRVGVQVHSCHANTSLICRLLGSYQGVFTHTVKVGRRLFPKPCLKTDCPQRDCEADRVWRPYLPAMMYVPKPKPRWQTIVLELTPNAWRTLKNHFDPQALRGVVIEVFRGATNSPVEVTPYERFTKDLGFLPQSFDVEPILRRMWRMAPITPQDRVAEKPPPYVETPEVEAPPQPTDEPAKLSYDDMKKKLEELRRRTNGGGQ